MAARIAARCMSRRVFSDGKVLIDEEKAMENVYIKVIIRITTAQVEKEWLKKLGEKGPKPESAELDSGTPESGAYQVKPNTTPGSSTSTAGVSNYAAAVGARTTAAGAHAVVTTLGKYLLSKRNKSEDDEDSEAEDSEEDSEAEDLEEDSD